MGVSTRARSGVRDDDDAGGRSCEDIGQISPDPGATWNFGGQGGCPARLQREVWPEEEEAGIVGSRNACCWPFS